MDRGTDRQTIQTVCLKALFTPQLRLLTLLRKKALESNEGNGENAVTSIFFISHYVSYRIKTCNNPEKDAF